MGSPLALSRRSVRGGEPPLQPVEDEVEARVELVGVRVVLADDLLGEHLDQEGILVGGQQVLEARDEVLGALAGFEGQAQLGQDEAVHVRIDRGERVAGELRTADTCDVVALPEGDFEDGDGGPFGPDGGDVTRVAVRLFLRAGAEKSGVPPVLAWPALSTAGGGSCRVDRVSGGAKRALWRRDGRHLAELHFVHVKAAARIGSRTGVRAALQSFTGALADPFGGAWLWALGQLAGHADAIAGAAGTASAIRVLEVVDQAPATGGFGPVRRFGLELVVPAQSAD